MIVNTKDGYSVNGVKVVCITDKGRAKEVGFINIYNGKTLTVGWNCKMEHADLKVPKIALGIAVSRMDDNDDIRRRRGLQDFSILAQDSNREEILGISANTTP